MGYFYFLYHTTSFPWFKSFKWTNLLSLLFCRSFDEDFLWFPDKKTTNKPLVVHLTSPFHAAPVQQIAPHRWWRSPPCFHQGLGWWVFPPAFPPKICAACQIWIPWFHSIFPRYHFRWWRFSNKNRWKKLPTHRCLQFFENSPPAKWLSATALTFLESPGCGLRFWCVSLKGDWEILTNF